MSPEQIVWLKENLAIEHCRHDAYFDSPGYNAIRLTLAGEPISEIDINEL